jgi:hypothetical protein
VTDLALIYESLISGLRMINAEWRLTNECRRMNSSLHGRLYSLAVTNENVGCLFTSAKTLLNLRWHRNAFCTELVSRIHLHFSMDTCVKFAATLWLPKESYLRGIMFPNSFTRNGLHVTILITWCPVLLLIKQSHSKHPQQLHPWGTSSKTAGKWVRRMRPESYSK